MVLSIFYTEIEHYMSMHYGKTIRMSRISDQTVGVTYTAKAFMFKKSMSIDLTVVEAVGSQIVVVYSGGKIVDCLAGAFVNILRGKSKMLAEGITRYGARLEINLAKIPRFKEAFNHIRLQELKFCDNCVDAGITIS